METVNYSDLIQFQGLYLEDSYVLQIIETTELVSFQIEFVLTKDHSLYQEPLDGEIYCYHFGVIDFISPEQVIWEYKNQKAVSIDANGESDLGNIDVFSKYRDGYSLSGDWGSIFIRCKELEIKLNE